MTTISKARNHTSTRASKTGTTAVKGHKGKTAGAVGKRVKAPSAFEIDMLVKTGKNGPSASISRVIPQVAKRPARKPAKPAAAPSTSPVALPVA